MTIFFCKCTIFEPKLIITLYICTYLHRTDYVTWNGPDPDIRKGPSNKAKGPNSELAKQHTGIAKGPNPENNRGPKGLATGSLFMQKKTATDASTSRTR